MPLANQRARTLADKTYDNVPMFTCLRRQAETKQPGIGRKQLEDLHGAGEVFLVRPGVPADEEDITAYERVLPPMTLLPM